MLFSCEVQVLYEQDESRQWFVSLDDGIALVLGNCCYYRVLWIFENEVVDEGFV